MTQPASLVRSSTAADITLLLSLAARVWCLHGSGCTVKSSLARELKANFLSCTSGRELPDSMSKAELGQFLLRTEVLHLYRACFRATKLAPDHAKGAHPLCVVFSQKQTR